MFAEDFICKKCNNIGVYVNNFYGMPIATFCNCEAGTEAYDDSMLEENKDMWGANQCYKYSGPKVRCI